ncbi:MAG: hypothetical protein KatS3mg109_1948 [Pirellulaceae bacterium]|nr:MAG: hypothetical protein KatS3mg109_1948 [Pirellulaceae bacterium]
MVIVPGHRMNENVGTRRLAARTAREAAVRFLPPAPLASAKIRDLSGC